MRPLWEMPRAFPPPLVKPLKAKEVSLPYKSTPQPEEESCPNKPSLCPKHCPGTEWSDFVTRISQIRKRGAALFPPFLSFLYLFIRFNLYHPVLQQICGQLLRQGIVRNTEQLGNQISLHKTIASAQAGSLFLQLYFTGVEKKPYFLELGKSISHPPFHSSDPSLNTLFPAPNKWDWSGRTRLVVETFYFVVNGSAIFVVSKVSLSKAIFER